MIDAYTQVYTKLESLGHKPKIHSLDNECSRCMQNFSEKGTRRHCVVPHNLRVNTAAVKFVKYHLNLALVALDWSYPIQLWSKALKQIQGTVNMFRTKKNDTTKTAYQELRGEFD